MKKIILIAIAMALLLPIIPFSGTSHIAPVRADGNTTTFTKAVDTDGNNDYADDGKTVLIGGTIKYRITWAFTPGTQNVVSPYVVDTVPTGTTYVNPSANPTTNVEYSTNGGASWNAGQPPNGSPAGTMIRWNTPSMFTSWIGANASSWNRSQALAQPSDIDVSRTNNGSPSSISDIWYDMKLDSNNYPCIVWQDNGDPRDATAVPKAGLPTFNTHLYFVRWNGANWVCQNGTVYNPTAAYPNTNAMIPVPTINFWNPQHPRLALDSNDAPHIVFDAWRNISGGNYDIHFVQWDTGTARWIDRSGNLPTNQCYIYAQSPNSYYPQIEMDSSNNAIVTWFEELILGIGQYRIFTCRIPGTLGTETDLQGGSNISSYTITRSATSRIGTTFSMSLDSNNRPGIAFENGNPAEIHFVRWNGSSWRDIYGNTYTTGSATSNVTNTGSGDSSTPWLKFDSSNNPRITWNEIRPNPVNTICYLGWSSTNGRWETVTGASYNAASLNASVLAGTMGGKPAMDLDRNYRPCIAFYGGFMRWNGASWINGSGNLASSNTTDGTGTLTLFAAQFNPIDLRTVSSVEKIGIVTGMQGSPASIYDVAYIQTNIPSPQSGTYYFNVTAPVVTPSICNTAQFIHQHVVGGALTTQNSNTVCNSMTEISLAKIATKSNYLRTEDIGFDILINNPTAGVTNNVVLTDTIPANLVYKNSSLTPSSVTATTITYNIGNLAANSSIAIHINFTVNPAYVFNYLPLNVTNTATVTSTQYTPKTANASARIDEIGMTFAKTANKTSYKFYEKVIYTISVKNIGTLPYTGVTIDDPLPTDLVFESISPAVGTNVNNVYKIVIGTINPGVANTYTLTFSVNKNSIKNKEKNGLTSFDIINTATLKRDNYENMVSSVKSRILLPKLQVIKSASRSSMSPDDTVTFTIVAKNISDVETTNTALYDVFPNELVYVSSEPVGAVKQGKLEYDLGTFNPGESHSYSITFKIKPKDVWPDNGISVINTAILSCTELDNVVDHAMVAINLKRSAGPLDLVCKWGNLDSKTNVLSGSDLSLELYATGGGSPYDFTIDWGDGSPKTMKSSVPESDIVKTDHTFTAGEYIVTIKCVDKGARTKIVTRKITVK